MAALESVLRIRAIDETGAAFGEVEKKIKAVEALIGSLDKLFGSIGKTMRAADPMSSTFRETERALAAERNELSGVVAGLDRIVSAADRAASAQRNLVRSIELTNRALSHQNTAAARAGGAHSGPRVIVAGHGGEHGGVLGVLPFAGPAIERGAEKYFEAGATTEEEIARLKALGASQTDIDKARGDWRSLSKTYAGLTEREYLSGYRSARVVAPGESFEMAELGAKYRLALRNSGHSASEFDVENIMKIMDEQGLKTPAQREDFVNQMLKTQQTYGSQIKTETMLSAYRNAKQSIYDWSDKFKNSYFPTILQSAGEQGGTEIMTAFNNWVGAHMSHAELKAMADAGFVDPKDLIYNKTGDIKGIKSGAHPYKSDLFKSNIAEWSWDFHDTFMKRKGATEGGFDDLVARMPRNMAALVSFLVHNQDRIKRDAETREHAAGYKAAGNDYLAQNPVAGWHALTESLEAFLGVASQPTMKAAGEGLAATAAGLQKLAGAYGQFAKDNPKAAEALGIGAGVGAAGIGGYLSWKMFTGLGRFFGFGGGAVEGAGGAAGGGAAAAGGPLSAFGWGWSGALAPLTGAAAGAAVVGGLYAWLKDFHDPGLTDEQLEKSRRSGMVAHPGGWVYDPEAHRGGALSRLIEGGHTPTSVQVDSSVRGEATINGTIRVEAGSELLRVVNQAISIAQQMALNPVAGGHSGRMDSDAAPLGAGGIGHR